jgi:hypothetical protein
MRGLLGSAGIISHLDIFLAAFFFVEFLLIVITALSFKIFTACVRRVIIGSTSCVLATVHLLVFARLAFAILTLGVFELLDQGVF